LKVLSLTKVWIFNSETIGSSQQRRQWCYDI